MQGLQRATEAARASRGRAPRIVHARSIAGGNNTMCGRGGVTFSAPITDTPDEVTCKNCLKICGAIERDRAARSEWAEPVVTTTMFTPAEQAAWDVAVGRGLALTAADLRAMLEAAAMALMTDLRDEIRHLRAAADDHAADLMGKGKYAGRAFGKVDAFDQVLALMAHTGTEG